MLGKRQSQANLFECDQVYRKLVGEESFYVYLAEHRHELFHDEDFADLYCSDNGRTSVPPSLLAVALLLQWYDDASDEEAARRARLDLSWKVALGIELMDTPFVKSVLCEFRNKLIVHKRQKQFFDASLKHARTKGFFKARNIKVALDTTPIFGRGAVEDTYNMLAEGLRQVVRVLATCAAQSEHDFAAANDFTRYTAPSFKGTCAINWDIATERATVLESLVADCDRILLLARQALTRYEKDSPEALEIVSACELLSRLLVQDVTRTAEGQPEIINGVAPDRIVSVHDPEMRHGRKSATQRFNGFKGAIAVETETQLITDVDVIPANAHDSQNSAQLIAQSAETSGASVDTVLGDTAYGSIAQRLAAENNYTLIAPVARPPQTGRFTKDEFLIDLDNRTVTCPAGKTTTRFYRRKEKTKHDRVFTHKKFHFAADDCGACLLRARCIADGVTHRTILVHEHESLIREAKRFQATDAFRSVYRPRVVVEHRIARLVQLGVRKARYFGNAKVLFQLAMTATVANLTLIAASNSGTRALFFVNVVAMLITLQLVVRWLCQTFFMRSVLIQNFSRFKKGGLRPGF
jgi:transposase